MNNKTSIIPSQPKQPKETKVIKNTTNINIKIIQPII